MVTITLAVGGGNTTTIYANDEQMMATRTRGAVRAADIQPGDVIPDFPGSHGSCPVQAVEVS